MRNKIQKKQPIKTMGLIKILHLKFAHVARFIYCLIIFLIFSHIFANTAQDRGPFWFSYILNELLQDIEIWNEFKV